MACKFECVATAGCRRITTADDGKRWQVQDFKAAINVKVRRRTGNLRQQLGIRVFAQAHPMMIRALHPFTLEFVHFAFRIRRSLNHTAC